MNLLNNQTYIIAEIGVNHGGNVGLAKEMVLAAKKAGANAVKFQTFTAESLVGKEVPKVKYQLDTTKREESHFEMIKSLEFSREAHKKIFSFCQELNIDFISTPYDIISAQFLTDLGIKIFKTASADIVDLELQAFIASTGKISIVSTGMATLGETEEVVNIYRKYGNHDKLVLLHCVSNYPCTHESLNLKVIQTLKKAFQTEIGFSDHSVGPLASALAVALGATVVEKHFTLDKNLPGPDHKASSTPDEFKELVDTIRQAEVSLGSQYKECQEEEREMGEVSRKSLTLVRPVKKGEQIIEEHLTLKRPGTGLRGNFNKYILGQKAKRDLEANTKLSLADIDFE